MVNEIYNYFLTFRKKLAFKKSSIILFLVILIYCFAFNTNIILSAQEFKIASESHTYTTQQHTLHATHLGNSKHKSHLFEFNPYILVSQIVNFFILLYILNKFFISKIKQVISERQKIIEDKLSYASKKLEEATQLKSEFEDKLANFKEICYLERQKIIKEAYDIHDHIIENAKKEAQNILSFAQKQIELEKEKSWIEIRDKILDLTKLTTEKVISVVLDDKLQHNLIKKIIQEVELELETEKKDDAL